MAYRDSKTGRFCSKACYNRSRAQGGKRYKKVAPPPRPRPKKRQKPRKPPRTNFIVTVKIKTREKRRGRSRTREFSRDIIVPARKDATKAELMAIAIESLPKKEQYAAKWLTQRGSKITIAEGPRTWAKKASLR